MRLTKLPSIRGPPRSSMTGICRQTANIKDKDPSAPTKAHTTASMLPEGGGGWSWRPRRRLARDGRCSTGAGKTKGLTYRSISKFHDGFIGPLLCSVGMTAVAVCWRSASRRRSPRLKTRFVGPPRWLVEHTFTGRERSHIRPSRSPSASRVAIQPTAFAAERVVEPSLTWPAWQDIPRRHSQRGVCFT